MFKWKFTYTTVFKDDPRSLNFVPLSSSSYNGLGFLNSASRKQPPGRLWHKPGLIFNTNRRMQTKQKRQWNKVNKLVSGNSLFFLFQLLPLGVVTEDHLHLSHLILKILFYHTDPCISSFTTSINLICDFLLLLSAISMFNILFPVYQLSLLCPSSNHINLNLASFSLQILSCP